jgi:hypothetical protein
MDARNPHLGQACDHHLHFEEGICCLWGTLAWIGDDLPPLSTWMPTFGGLDITYIAHESPLRGLEDQRFNLGANITLEGMTSPFLGLFCAKMNLCNL